MDIVTVGSPFGTQLSSLDAMILVRLIRAFVFVCGVCALVWLGGLILFAEHIRDLDAQKTDNAAVTVDAIVVLTGGSERVRTGLELLKEGRGKKLFISGVYPGLSLDTVIGSFDLDPALRQCCVVLGHAAGSTEGNAEETQTWLELEHYHSFRLVTANYHMPRSLLLFRASLPDMTIVPHPIARESVVLDEWWRHAGTANLLVSEYNKYLFARLGILMGAV